ncbi:c-type cytochrome [Acidovorax sp. LjRoot129]|uniref:c-type cytochrome n=1 Tax=Acidovorax sp. LjRoot129 TaxID=3342260 RepID=UPI003ECEB8D7
MTQPKLFLIVAATASALAVAALLGAALVVYGGLYDVAATRQHSQPMYSVLEVAMRQSVRLRARDIAEPPLADERMALRGAACFRDKCVQCHGAPGVAQGDIGKSMQPLPGPLVDARQHWRPRELYWLVRHGLKMTGMPAWEYRLADSEIWDVVAFMQHLPTLNATQYAHWQQRTGAEPAMPACGRTTETVAPTTAVDVQRGRQALHQYACTACHSIPGVTGPAAFVGPPLDRFSTRGLIAGTLSNTPDNMVQWLMHTQKVKPGTAMPELGVAPQDARDMAAYLATLR